MNSDLLRRNLTRTCILRLSAACALLALPLTPVQSQNPSKASAKPINVHDDFEGPTLSPLWAHDRFEEGAVVLESNVVRAGKQAVAITVHSNDKFEAGQNGNSNSERDELREANELLSRQNVPYEFSFSMFFPAEFPIVPVRLVIAQWKQYCGSSTAACEDDSPVLALRYIGGVLRVTQDIDHKQVKLYEQTVDLRNRWTDFKVQARFTPDATGRVRVWIDQKQVVDKTGVTANPEDATTGYASPSQFYFKMGLYRNVMPQPMTIYIDEYSKREMKADEL
jgi:hypothetical protein